MRFKPVIALLLLWTSLAAEPWGKDSDLAYYRPNPPCQPSGEKTPNILIRFYQNHISPCSGPQSHHIPSSSEYTRQAIEKYGFFKGFLLGCDRLIRENDDPWVYREAQGPYGTLKFDPVP